MRKINFKNSSFLIFIIISIWYFFGNFIWWYLNTPIIPSGSSAIHFLDVFKNSILYSNAPLITWIMKIIFSVFGKHYFDLQIILVNYFLFLMALYFIYKIGLELKDKEAGNIAMILFSLVPMVYILSRSYGHQDWHVMIAMTVNIYCLIKLNNFKDIKWSILYGITVGLGLLIKDAFLMFFFVPWLYVVLRSLIEKNDFKKKIINIFLTILTGSLIAGCHYFRTDIINKILNEPVSEIADNSIFAFENIRVTTLGLSEYLLSPPLFIMFIIGLLWFIFKYKNKNKIILLLWIVIPWTIITFMPAIKTPEYFLGMVPALILILSIFLIYIKKTFLKQTLIYVLIVICIFQFFKFSYASKDTFGFITKYKNNEIYYFVSVLTRCVDFLDDSSKEFLNNLKKYKDYTIYVEDMDNNIFSLYILMCIYGYDKEIKNFCDIELFYMDDEKIVYPNKNMGFVNDNDIVIFSKRELPNSDIAEHIYYYDTNNFNKSLEYKNEKIRKNLEQIDIGKKYIQENFYFVEDFYWENMGEKHLFKIYKKK